MFVDMEPEDQLCLLLARGEISGEVRERTFQLLASPLRWPLFLEHARKYDICPIIYQKDFRQQRRGEGPWQLDFLGF